MKSIAMFFLVFAVLGIPDAVGKTCKKGQPCGNSCISWKKTCRIGTQSYKSAPSTYNSPDYSNNSTNNSHHSDNNDAIATYKVIANVLNIRAQPNSKSKVIGTLTSGQYVWAYGTNGNWTKFNYKNGVGWVYSAYLKKL